MQKKISVIIVFILVCSLLYGAKLQRTQLFPSTGRLQPSDEIKGPHIKEQFIHVKQWADKLNQFLDMTLRKVADIPFNQSESLTVADTGNADTTKTATHHLGRIPNGLIVTRIDKAGIIYVDSTDYGNWTTTQISFKCSVANAEVVLSVF